MLWLLYCSQTARKLNTHQSKYWLYEEEKILSSSWEMKHNSLLSACGLVTNWTIPSPNKL